MAVPFLAYESAVPRIAKLLKSMAKLQKEQDEVCDSLGRTNTLYPMAATTVQR